MKTLVNTIIAVVASAMLVNTMTKRQLQTVHELETNTLVAQVTDLEKALQEEKNARKDLQPEVITETIIRTNEVMVPVATGTDPNYVIERLVALKPGGSGFDYDRTRRRIVHQFETLYDLGTNAIPVIHGVLAMNADVSYDRPPRPQPASTQSTSQQRPERKPDPNREASERIRNAWVRLPSRDFSNPPSLRLGLMETAAQIGGPEAEAAIAEVLGTSGRGIEVAYAVRLLEDMNPGAYRELAIEVATDLLSNPVAGDDIMRSDQYNRNYLFAVLQKYGDQSYIASAQQQIITEDGKIDHLALNWMSSTLKEAAVPALYQAFMDPRVTNRVDRGKIYGHVSQQVGKHPQADMMFKEIINNMEDTRTLYYAISALDGGGDVKRPEDPTVIRNRMNLMESALANMENEKLKSIINSTYENLTSLSKGEKIPQSGRRR